MAGDWIKMRVGLVTHPKVISLSEHLSYMDEYQDWSGLAGFIPSIGGSKEDFEDDVSQALRVTRYVTVTALLKFWGYANEHAKDEFIPSLRISSIDEISGVPGFGKSLEAIGWAIYDKERKGVFLPNFSEHNAIASDRTSAERQKRYRERKKQETLQGDVTRDVTSNAREEKRREDISIRKTKIVLLDDGTFDGLESHLPVWENAYPSLDVMSQIRKAGSWCKSNPKRAPKSDYPRFLNGWLSRANDSVSNDDPFAGAI